MYLSTFRFVVVTECLHSITRLVFVTSSGIIFQNANVTYQVKGDPLNRTITIPGMAAIHKKLNETRVTKVEAYINAAPLVSVMGDLNQSEARG